MKTRSELPRTDLVKTEPSVETKAPQKLSQMPPGPERAAALRAFAAKFPPPQEWYDEDESVPKARKTAK